jgi:hypothetical protein
MFVIFGVLGIAIGAAIVIKSEAMLEAFGRIQFFEDKLGMEGGSRLGYKLIGLAVTFIGILTLTGLIDSFMLWILSPLLRYSRME